MGLFDVLKNKISSFANDTQSQTEPTAARQEPSSPPQKMRSDFDYDFDTLDGIKKIKMPRKSVPMFESPEYMLQLQATRHFDEGNDELAFACLRKSNELMPKSKTEYPAKTYCRLVKQLKQHDRFEEAAVEEAKLRKNHPEFFDGGKTFALKNLHTQLAYAKEFGTDLLEMSVHEGACAECAKYQGRVFSISGTDSEFPPLPHSVFEYGGIHLGCQHCFHTFMRGSTPAYKHSVDIVRFSNRPFIDDRTESDKILHAERAANAEHYLIDLLGDDKKIKDDIAKKKEYALVCENVPDLAPKTYSGYNRMKKNQTKTFLKIQNSMRELGFEL